MRKPAEVAVRVPIEFQHVPQHLEISSVTIPEAQIRVRGPERLIRQLRSTDLHAELELGDAKPGERTFDLTAQQIRHQRDLHIVQVVPGQVHLSFDTRLTREVKIHPEVTGNFAAGEQIAKVLVDPERITITGPQHHVEAGGCGYDRSGGCFWGHDSVNLCDQRVYSGCAGAGGAADAGARDGDYGEECAGGKRALRTQYHFTR